MKTRRMTQRHHNSATEREHMMIDVFIEIVYSSALVCIYLQTRHDQSFIRAIITDTQSRYRSH